MTVADRVLEIREQRDLTLRAFGKIVGCSGQYAHRIEAGQVGLSLKRAVQWANALGERPEVWVEKVLQTRLDRAKLKYKVRCSP